MSEELPGRKAMKRIFAFLLAGCLLAGRTGGLGRGGPIADVFPFRREHDGRGPRFGRRTGRRSGPVSVGGQPDRRPAVAVAGFGHRFATGRVQHAPGSDDSRFRGDGPGPARPSPRPRLRPDAGHRAAARESAGLGRPGRGADAAGRDSRRAAAERVGSTGRVGRVARPGRPGRGSRQAGAARVYYKMVLRRASGELRQEVAARLARLEKKAEPEGGQGNARQRHKPAVTNGQACHERMVGTTGCRRPGRHSGGRLRRFRLSGQFARRALLCESRRRGNWSVWTRARKSAR